MLLLELSILIGVDPAEISVGSSSIMLILLEMGSYRGYIGSAIIIDLMMSTVDMNGGRHYFIWNLFNDDGFIINLHLNGSSVNGYKGCLFLCVIYNTCLQIIFNYYIIICICTCFTSSTTITTIIDFVVVVVVVVVAVCVCVFMLEKLAPCS